MSALAQLLLALGHNVSGSDRYYDQGLSLLILKKLRALGVTLFPQNGGGGRDDQDVVVVSSAIEEDNPDLVAAREKKIKILHRAELLASLAERKKIIAVTGTAGKTTVTGMIGFCLEQAGWDPMVVNGGGGLDWLDGKRPGNFRFGRSNTWVLELDESDRSLLHFAPDWAVVTNISQDHFELEEVKSLFATFARQVKNGIVGCDSCKDFAKIGPHDPSDDGTNLISVTERGVSFQYKNHKFQLPLLGKHNIENALNCVMLCEQLGLDLNGVSLALEKFKGIERRLQAAGSGNGVTIVDDYAHNPVKIAAAWDAVRPFSKRILAVWRPHGYGPLKLMRRDLIDVFLKRVRPEDLLVVMSVYFAGGTAQKQFTARMFAEELGERNIPVEYADDYEAVRAVLLKFARPGDTVLLMGARDPDLPVFARNFVLDLDHFLADRPSGAGGVAQEDQSSDQA